MAVLANKRFTGHRIALLSILTLNSFSRAVCGSGLGFCVYFKTVRPFQNILLFFEHLLSTPTPTMIQCWESGCEPVSVLPALTA